MHEEDRTASTGPSGSRPLSTHSGAVDATARATKPSGDHAVTAVDRNLAALVRSALSGDPSLPVRDDNIHVKVDNGHVSLHGWVKSEQEKEMISARVRAVEGVRALDNQLQIASGANPGGSRR
jgi:osmotically-inducible protein OsmY